MNTIDRPSDLHDTGWAGVLRGLVVFCLIAMSFLYTLSFDYMPGKIRLMMAGMIAAGFIVLSFERVLFSREPAIRWMFAGLCLVVLAWALGAVINPFDPERAGASFTIGFRNISGLFSGVAILGYADRVNPKLVLYGFIALIVMAAAVALTQPGIQLAGTTRVHPFTGDAGLHASAYVVALAMLGSVMMWRNGQVSNMIALPVLLLSGYTLMGYQVRTAMVIVLIAALVASFQFVTSRTRFLMPILLCFGVAAGLFVVLFLFSRFDGSTWGQLVSFSSGRLATYAERISILAQRDTLGQLLGSGPGSDLGFSRQWYWDVKDSHNDFLRLFKEGGIVGIFGVALYFIGIFRFAKYDGLPLVLCLVGSSAISNALLARPTIIVFFFLTLVLLSAQRRQALNQAWRPDSHAMGFHNKSETQYV